MKRTFLAVLSLLFVCCCASLADDGSALWLHRTSGSKAPVTLQARSTPTTDIAVQELTDGWSGGPVTLRLAKQKGMKRDAFTIRRKEGVVTISSLPASVCSMAPTASCRCRRWAPLTRISN